MKAGIETNQRRFAFAAAMAVALCLATGAPSAASAQGVPIPRILLVGDSWAAQQWRDRVFRDALALRGLGAFEERGAVTTRSGSTAAQWATTPNLDLITSELVAHPTIDIVHLSIGGNDFIQAASGDVIELVILFFEVLEDIRSVVDHIHAIRPEARVVYAVYDYVNFAHGFSTELAILALAVRGIASTTPNFYLLDDLGVLHHAFGYPGAFGPAETPLPGGYPRYSPLLGGDPALPGNPEAFDDEIHPTTAGYLTLAQHAVDEFYGAWLGPQLTVAVVPLDGDGAIDPAGDEIIAVIVYGSETADTRDLDIATLAFGPLGATAWLLPGGLHLDIDRDGLLDHVSLYRSARAGFVSGDSEACLQYDRLDGIAVQGCAPVSVP